MAIEVPQNEEISGGGKDGGRKRSRFCHLSDKVNMMRQKKVK